MEKLTDEIFERLYVPVGRFVVYWGAVDVAVNHVAFAIFRHINTTPQAQRWPLGLHYRLKRLKSLIGKHPDFKPFAKDAREVFRDTLHQLKDREMLAHGVAVRYIRDKDTILFERIDELTKGQRKRSGPVTHRLNSKLFSFADLDTLGRNAAMLGGALLEVCTSISELSRQTKDTP
jgi:hypothetical protein